MTLKNFQQAKALFQQGKTVSDIERELDIRRATIREWLRKDQYVERRGWSGGKRTHTDEEEQRIVSIKKLMIEKDCYFLGPKHIRMNYEKTYPSDDLPSLWFFQDVIRRNGIQSNEPKKRTKGKGIVERLFFPIQSIVKLGRIQQSVDFIGKKFILGRSDPISVFSTSYYQWFDLYQVWRTLAETSEYAIQCLLGLWMRSPIPHVLRMDNGMTFRGTGVVQGHIGKFVKFLLNLNIIPLFSSAYQSYTNPHIEGHNRTFTEKLWSKHHFVSPEAIDIECERFNLESREFYEWNFKERLGARNLRYLKNAFEPRLDSLRSVQGKKIYFIRFTERWNEQDRRCGIVVLNWFVPLPVAFVNQYVLAVLNLETATLHAYSEHDGISTEILRQPFNYTL